MQFNKDFMNNPLFHIGMGLLSVPGKSLNPSDVSWGPGVARGLQGYQHHQYAQADQQAREAKQQLLEEKLRQEQEQAAAQLAQTQAQQAALPGLLDQLPEEKRAKVQMLIAADPEAGMKTLQKELFPEGPKGLLGQWLENPNQVEAFKRAMTRIEGPRGGSTNVTNVLPGTPYKPQTTEGKRYTDLFHLQQQRDAQAAQGADTSQLDAVIGKLKSELTAEPQVGPEQARTELKMSLVEKTARDFNTLAEKNDSSTGILGGRISGARGALGMGSEDEYQMAAMEAQMETQLGTALSGAAIPESEWPRYRAQIPRRTDSKNEREAKAKVLGRMMDVLEKKARERRGQAPLEMTVQPPLGSNSGDYKTETLKRYGIQ